MHRITALSTFALFLCTSAYAAWVPVDCKDRPLEVQSLHGKNAADLEKIRQNYRAAVLKAKPGSPLYVPHPYPKTREEIIENFRQAYFDRLFAGKSLESLPESERPLYKAFKEGKLRTDVLRIDEIAPGAPKTSILARRDQQIREGLQPLGVQETDAPLVTLGFEWARARRVGGPKP